MYPLHCHAGYAMPIRAGKHRIVAIGAKVSDTSATTQFSIWDTAANTTVNSDSPPQDATRLGHFYLDDASSPFFSFPEPLTVHKGISIGNAANLDAGQLYVYVR